MLNADWLIPDWPVVASVKACVTTRTNAPRTTGRSQPPYDAFNLGLHVGDDAHQVLQNRMALQRCLGLAEQPAWLNQTHSNDVVHWQQAQHAWATTGKALDVDAVYSDASQQACVVMTADCLPVLFTNRYGTQVAAAHAGWKGLLNGVLTNTVKALNCPAGQVWAWFGPAIGCEDYEVDEHVYHAFVDKFGEVAKACFSFTRFSNDSHGSGASGSASAKKAHYLCDLYALARLNLLQIGLSPYRLYGAGGQSSGTENTQSPAQLSQEIVRYGYHNSPQKPYSTYRDERFYSYRENNTTGRFASLIWLE